jgi:hypothetical protein
VLAAVDLDDHLDAVRREEPAGPGRALDRVHADRHPAALRQAAEPLGGPLVDVHRIGDEQVGAAVLGEDLRLAQRRHGEADRALAELEPGDLG